MTSKTGQAKRDHPLSGGLLERPAGGPAETRDTPDAGAGSKPRSAAITLEHVYALPGPAIGLVYLAAYEPQQ